MVVWPDDSLLLLKADLEVLENQRGLLLILEGVTNLKVNLRKSSMAPVGNV